MKTVQISLNSIDKVKSFVNAITQYEYDSDLWQIRHRCKVHHGYLQFRFIQAYRPCNPCREQHGRDYGDFKAILNLIHT